MNSGTGNLIGSVSYELASVEACRTKAQHEPRPASSKPSAQHNAAKATPGPAGQGARTGGLRAALLAWAERPCGLCAGMACTLVGHARVEFVFTYET